MAYGKSQELKEESGEPFAHSLPARSLQLWNTPTVLSREASTMVVGAGASDARALPLLQVTAGERERTRAAEDDVVDEE